MVENYKDWEQLKGISSTEEIKPGDKLVWVSGDGVFFKNGDIVTIKSLFNSGYREYIQNFKEPDRGTMWHKSSFAKLPEKPIECPHPEWLGDYINHDRQLANINWDSKEGVYLVKKAPTFYSNPEDNRTITLNYSATTAHPLINKEDPGNSYIKVEPYKSKRNSKLRVDVFGGFYD